MTDIRALLSDLRRPRLLIRAARFGLGDYRRDRLLDAVCVLQRRANCAEQRQQSRRLVAKELYRDDPTGLVSQALRL